MRAALSMCAARSMNNGVVGGGRFLFEVIPDLIPYGYFTEIERELWNMFTAEVNGE